MSIRSWFPSDVGQEVGQLLIDADELQREVLEETLTSAEQGTIRESGRTLCPAGADRVRPPFNRTPQTVQLSQCPVGASGTVHSHPTVSQLRRPEHSLPDMALVFLEDGIAASMVVGLEQSEVLMQPTEKAATADRFRDILGVDAYSTQEVADARDVGEIDDPVGKRQVIQRELGALFRRVDTAFPDLEQMLAAIDVPDMPVAAACADEGTWAGEGDVPADTPDAGAPLGPRAAPGHIRQRQSRCAAKMRAASGGINLQDLVISTVVGNIVGNVVDRTLFG